MPEGSLKLQVIDLVGDAIDGKVRVRATRAKGGAGGQPTIGTFPAGDTVLQLTGIRCQPGAGTAVRVAVATKNFRRFQLIQRMRADRVNRAAEYPIRLVVDPKKVENITAPSFGQLSSRQRGFLDGATMIGYQKEDRDLAGLSGSALYDALGPLRKACLLNVLTKARHKSSHGCGRFIRTPLVLRQDRCFCVVDEGMEDLLERSDQFITAPDSLHKPLPGYRMLKRSYKSKDSHANLQVTFMQHGETGKFAADIDIDEASGFTHGLEVIRNKLENQRTNPYLVRELLVLQSLDPKYRFVFA